MIIYEAGNINRVKSNIRNKKVLILGSGPSANEVNWKKYDSDIVITTSFFYLVQEVIDSKPIHVSLSKMVDLGDKRLLNYLDENNKCTISFEPKIKSQLQKIKNKNCSYSVGQLAKNVHNFYRTKEYDNFLKKYNDRMCFYRIQGGIEGIAGRLCWLALFSKPKEIAICGIDGISKNHNLDPDNYFRGHKGMANNYTYDENLKSYTKFAKKLYERANQTNVKILNLGEGKSYNMITPVSKMYNS